MLEQSDLKYTLFVACFMTNNFTCVEMVDYRDTERDRESAHRLFCWKMAYEQTSETNEEETNK